MRGSSPTHGAKGGKRRGPISAETAVAYSPSLAELSKGGKMTATGIKARIRQVKQSAVS